MRRRNHTDSIPRTMDQVEHKTPPHDAQAEQAILGAVFKDNAAMAAVRDTIRPQDFYLEQHQIIFEAMVKLADQGVPIDLVTMMDHLDSAGLLGEAGRVSYLCQLIDATPTAENARHYARIVRGKTKRRNVQRTIEWLQEIALADRGDEEELEAVLSVLIREVRQGIDKNPSLNFIGDFIDEAAEHLDGKYDGLPTGFPEFDYKLFGLAGLTILGAAPKVGKSVWALNVALNVARKGGVVHYYDVENGRPLVMRRLLSNFYSKTITQLKNERAWQGVAKTDFPTAIPGFHLCTEHAGMKPDVIHREAQKIEGKDVLIVLDSLQKLPPLEKQRRDSIDRWLRELEQIKHDVKITILLISELSRGEKETHYRNPTLGAFKESGDIEYSMDMGLQFTKAQGESGNMILHCVANRTGESGPIATYSYQDFKYWRWAEVPQRGGAGMGDRA
ncbi:hypothetical protein LCGC14_2359600, partial [marine sediment metagenome]